MAALTPLPALMALVSSPPCAASELMAVVQDAGWMLTRRKLSATVGVIAAAIHGADRRNHCYGYLHRVAEGRLLRLLSCLMKPLSRKTTLPRLVVRGGW